MSTSFNDGLKPKSILKQKNNLTYPAATRDSLTTSSNTFLNSTLSDDSKSLDLYVSHNSLNDKFHYFVHSMNDKDTLKNLTSSSSLSGSSSCTKQEPVKSVRFASNNNLVRVKTYNSLDQPNFISTDQKSLQKGALYNNLINGSKEFIGNNVRYCLREYYLDEQNKKRSIKMKKLQMKNNKEFLKQRQKSLESDKEFIDGNSDIYKLLKKKVDSEEIELMHSNLEDVKATGNITDYNDSDEDSDEDFEDEGLNFKNLSKLTISDTNFSNLNQWKTLTKSNSKENNLFDLKKLNKSYYNKNRHQSLTNLKHLNKTPDDILLKTNDRYCSSSLDNIYNLSHSKENSKEITPTTSSQQQSHHTRILDSNFNYQQNIMHQYPWQFNSNTIQVKSVYVSQSTNKLNVYLSAENIAFEKDIKLKYTFDNWNKIFYSQGIYEKQINSKFDEFKCVIDLPLSTNAKEIISELSFCCTYKVNSMVYYDNNNYHNFKLKLKTTKKVNYEPDVDSLASPNNYKSLVKPPNSPEKINLKRSFEQSKNFYNTSPWKNIYKQDSVTKIFNDVKNECTKNITKQEKANSMDPITNSKPILSAIPIIRRQSNTEDFNLWKSGSIDANYVIQNVSDTTSDSLLASDDYDDEKGFSPKNGNNILKIGPSFDNNDSAPLNKPLGLNEDFGNYNTISKTISFDEFNKSNEPRMNLPDINKFINEPKNDEVYDNLIKNYCFFSSENNSKMNNGQDFYNKFQKNDDNSKSSSCTIRAPVKYNDDLTMSSLNLACATSRPNS